jgi:hypothetical protein
MGIEPTLSAWEAEVLPLNYAREGAILAGFWAERVAHAASQSVQGVPSV